MGFFKQRKPRGFSHQYIYVDERRERLKEMEERAKRELGLIPEAEKTAEERIRGKFVDGTKHLKRRKESGRKPLTYAALILGIGALCYVLHYLVTGELTF